MSNGLTEERRFDADVTQNLHHSFVELESLAGYDKQYKWVERARWIKFEEDVDHLMNQWCQPYVPALSLKAFSELKTCLRNGAVCIGLRDSSLDSISDSIVCKMLDKHLLPPSRAGELKEILMARHKHIRKKADPPRLGQKWLSAARTMYPGTRGTIVSVEHQSQHNIPNIIDTDDSNPSIRNNEKARLVDISSKLPSDTEVTTVLTASLDFIKQPTAIFIKLKSAVHLGDLNEVTWPVRFLYFITGPHLDVICDYFQLGRCVGTLMSNSKFLTLAYFSEVGEDLLSGIDLFLEDSIILPAGDWTKQNLSQSIPRWEKQLFRQESICPEKLKKRVTTFALHSDYRGNKEKQCPLQRSGKPFGCLVNDIKRKLPFYRNDFIPDLDFHFLAAVLFIYLAALAPCITFGGLMSESTEGNLGISEMIIATGCAGIIFSLFAGQPLMIVGATGPMLILESKIYDLADILQVEFLPFRACIGLWVMLICMIIVALDLCGLIRQVTRFTEEIFAVLVSLIFIQKAIVFAIETFIEHPVAVHAPVKDYIHTKSHLNVTVNPMNASLSFLLQNNTHEFATEMKNPCYSLMTAILLILTFAFAYFFRKVRGSMYFPLKIRRIIGDFGVIFSVVAVVTLDSSLGDNYTKKLSIRKDYFLRKWFINPFGERTETGIGCVFLAALPAFLVSIILFIETGITAVMLDKKENKFKKGFGYHLDLIVVAALVGTGSLFGLPWMCISPVNSLSHFHTLTVLSSDHAPGTNPYIVNVKEQRITNMIIHIMIGSSLLLSPMLECIPLAVLFGVFLYLGFTSLARIEFTHRLQLLLIPYKLHPDSRFVRKVKTMKIHIFTLIQLCCVAVLAVIKETSVAAIFPFFILCLVPLRKCLKLFFTEEELEDLDNPEDEDEFGVPEEFETARVPVTF